jgi:hypothetical protein
MRTSFDRVHVQIYGMGVSRPGDRRHGFSLGDSRVIERPRCAASSSGVSQRFR